VLSRFPSVRYSDRVYCSEASEIQNKVGVAQKISDAELIALLCQAQHEIEAQGRSNEAPVLLADFAKGAAEPAIVRKRSSGSMD
jgi:hypothetical protein